MQPDDTINTTLCDLNELRNDHFKVLEVWPPSCKIMRHKSILIVTTCRKRNCIENIHVKYKADNVVYIDIDIDQIKF